MEFFNSVFSDDQSEDQEVQDQPNFPDPRPSSSTPSANAKPSIATITNSWSFGGLIKTLASKSESVIHTYRRDLEEFRSGLRKETAAIREVASRAVRDLPTSLEASAAVAQESLESIGEAIDNIGNRVSEIISHGKDSILAGDSDSETSSSKQISDNQQNLNLSSRPYSRFDAQIRAIQCDLNTYCKEPENLEEYNEWKLGFKLDENGGEIEDLIEDNGLIEEMYNDVVPSRVDRETFWSRYYYRVYKLKKAEEARAKLVQRAISGEDEEVLSWDVDDDDYEESDESKLMGHSEAEVFESSNHESEEKSSKKENDEKGVVSESKCDGGWERKIENDGSCKDSDFSVVSSQQSIPEEDLGWDEIEDTGSTDEIKVTASGSPNRADLRKRLSAMEEEEDLGWDIEDDDDDEPALS